MICASSWSMYYTTPQSVIAGSPRLFTRGGGPYTEGVDSLLKISDVGTGVDCPAGSYVLITATDWNAVKQSTSVGTSLTAGDLALMGITPSEMLTVFSWGFSLILFGWLMGYGVSLALGLIRRV